MTATQMSKARDDRELAPGARMFWGAIALASATVSYWLAAGLVNPLWYRDLPMALDVGSLLGGAVTYAVGGAVIGYLAARPESVGVGSLIGGAGIGILLSIGPVVAVPGAGVLLALVIFFPAFVLGLFVCAGIRLALNGPSRRGYLTSLAALAIGTAAGMWARIGPEQVRAIEIVRSEIAALEDLAPNASRPIEFNQAPNVFKHLRVPYVVSAQSVSDQPPTTEVRVLFDDGYNLTCYVINTTPTCSEFGATGLTGPTSDE